MSLCYTANFFDVRNTRMSTEQLIIGRLLCELKGASTFALGPGLPQQIVPYLSPTQDWVDLGKAGSGEKKQVEGHCGKEAPELYQPGHDD